ncbi:integrase domain-containing protein (plasmid) [Paraburkholderia sp. D15]|uniref:helix-turn-helix domain-containing protein n=1 Tax=Paraburkholderia sp. D15 TaxID=2880218 RepID=UPI002478B1EA|nr:helix-turn-helix domain-containing protein [Paraburkholderia sp. D15]WGS55075.1 integrase domain-containing protein [Paraburkholderia sp. D15]
MAAILNVRATVRRYALPQAFAAELVRLLDDHVNEIHSRTRVSRSVLSVKTQERRTTALCSAFVELRKGGFALESPWSLREKHVKWLVALWVKQEQSGGTIENKLTYLRALSQWIGKPALVLTLGNYVDRVEHGLKRSYVATADKSWSANDIDAAAKIAEIAQTCPYVAVQLKLQVAFGLRVEESFLLRPLEAVRSPQTLGVRHGTKGGLAREVPLEAKVGVLEEAARLSNGTTGSTVPADRSLKQWRDWYYYVLDKHGVTKAGLGVTSHGLRHEYLQLLYEKVSGVPAPIKGSDARAERDSHDEAMRRVVAAAGHTRKTKANAYLSVFGLKERLERQRRQPPTRAEVEKALLDAAGNKSRAAEALGISRQALYRLLAAS